MRPLPRPTALSRPFWDGCLRGKLLVQRCSGCARCFFIPSAFCPHCLHTAYEWTESAGRGHVVTCTVVWRPPTPAFEPPYVVAVVRLEEGYEMFTNIVGAEPDADLIGAAVRVRFHQESEDIALPFFELAAATRQRP
ncbi:putative OB-fold protein [Streptomyces sp. SAI-135]|uniref:Zn-ribbon domain-containing OB-fold protein n=1 Tax=unclassified Streptomyces TaxID=2593676 RepID=UPI002475D020|nr:MULTISPECIES: Zn-ribbon domain-containing OB-fold protein [unclassified Streptomyces]MDH6522822.1 putative OB-fold protein [Streptomyces sp. SAI-090]MDH6573709.1 putative OB-fold protein [Streptomyces sp. SAI-117]MDH6613563.1 putative OB-fold protein [Streptomyces sp. SAI-135]